MFEAVEPNARDREFARGLHREFAHHALSRFMASERSLTWLAATLRVYEHRTVVEFGGGIGTITAALLRHPCGVGRIVTTENDPRFHGILKGFHDSRLTLVASAPELAALDCAADLIVIDGGFRDELGDPVEAACARERTVVFVDGMRERQRRLLEDNLGKRGLSVDLTEHGLPRVHPYLYVNWSRPSVRFLRHPKGCWLGSVSAAAAQR